ncbi:MAG: hypothetical protein K0R25_169 [Rickettsiaceae bacterium]|jgi:hypothetical protein|nr:hypothetical protein [Rickettsiaceae bacterium]
MKIFSAILFVIFASASIATARPVAYPGGVSFMQHNDYAANSIHLNYTLNGKDTVGVMSEYQRQDKFWFHSAQYTRVLRRWNQDDSQGNLYFIGGLGGAEMKNNSKSGGFGGIEADFEDRRFYLYYKNSLMKMDGEDSFFRETARIGVAPYKGGYDDLQTWFMLQLDHTPYLKDNFVATPLVRVFKDEYLVEFGASSNKTILFNFMTFF